jgi:D-serine dehydratase
VVLRGIEAFEGILMITDEENRSKATGLLDSVVALARRCDDENLFGDGEVLLTAGGSTYFDQVQQTFNRARLGRPTRIVLRSGCYLTHDVGFYAPGYDYVKTVSENVAAMDGDLEPALEIWAHVQSLPEPGLGIAALGKRDISHDIVLPAIARRYRPGFDTAPRPADGVGEVAALNDQHAYLRLNPGHDLEVGDLLAFGLSHPCTTFDKWPVILLVDRDYNVIDGIRTYF